MQNNSRNIAPNQIQPPCMVDIEQSGGGAFFNLKKDMKTGTNKMEFKSNQPTVFKFWKGNKLTGFFQLTDKELIEKFNEWLPTKERSWLDYYGTRDCVCVFISEHLNSIGNTENNFAEYQAMEELLKPIKNNYL